MGRHLALWELGTLTLARLASARFVDVLHRRAALLQTYHFSTSFNEGPSEPKLVGSGDVANEQGFSVARGEKLASATLPG